MSYHTTLIKSKEFYSALQHARTIAADVQTMLNENDLDLVFFPYRYAT